MYIHRVQAMNVTDLEAKVADLTKQLATESSERQAAQESVLDLITLHLKVSELRERLAHEIQGGTDLKVGDMLPAEPSCRCPSQRLPRWVFQGKDVHAQVIEHCQTALA